jgi:hypothetical protein
MLILTPRIPMSPVQLRFYEELNDFLPPQRRRVTFTHELTRRTSVKDLIESFGVPHTEEERVRLGILHK